MNAELRCLTPAKLLAAQYRSTGDPTKILEGYLSVFTSGQVRMIDHYTS
jgi:hypothetical protein